MFRFSNRKIQTLKDRLSQIIPVEQERVKKLRKEHGEKKLGDVTVNMVHI